MSNAILKGDMAKLQAFEFVPPRLELGTPQQAVKYLEAVHKRATDFRMSDSIRIQTGVSKVEAENTEQNVEAKVLEKLKEIQEQAYQEAYQLGLDDGKKEAFTQTTLHIESRLLKMDDLITLITNLKKELMAQNESHLVQLVFHMASRLAEAEVKTEPSILVDVMRKAIELAQAEENITVQVNTAQVAFLEELKTETKREFEFLKKVRFEGSDEITVGGCIVETNYGQIDARFEERVSKLWETVVESIHRVKNRIGAA